MRNGITSNYKYKDTHFNFEGIALGILLGVFNVVYE